MNCPNCGKQIPANAQICRHCGAKIQATPTEQPVPEARTPAQPAVPASSGGNVGDFLAGFRHHPKTWGVWRWLTVAGVAVVVIGAISSGTSSSNSAAPAPTSTSQPVVVQPTPKPRPTTPPTATPRPTLAPTAVPPTPKPRPQTLLSVSGSGINTTRKFTTSGDDWDMAWSYDCTAAGGSGNFIVDVFNGDGSSDFNNAGTNQLGPSGQGVEHFHVGGTKYLSVNSECNWTVRVTG